MTHPKQVALIILDGWGWRTDTKDNAIAEAKTPFFDTLLRDYSHSVLDASGEEVGLPVGQIGNSEVGHMAIGAGKVIDTDLVKITKAMRAGEFATNHAIKAAFDHAKKHDSTLHLMGLLSPGGVHSHHAHALGLIRAAFEAGLRKIAIHAFTDGRDMPPQSAHEALEEVEQLLSELGAGVIATAGGRFFAMDRDSNWDRLAKAEDAIYHGKGRTHTGKASELMQELHTSGTVDEHLEPIVFLDKTGKAYTLERNDSVIFFNFRPDRARMLATKIAERAEKENICFTTLTQYDASIKSLVAFNPSSIETTIAAEVSKAGMTQAHIAETEKYAHATYFLNGGKETKNLGEEWILLPSRKDVQTHDLAPEMKAKEIADAALSEIEKGTNFIFINFANADMVGHTAKHDAIITAVETIDRELARVITALAARGGVALISADHGNAEMNVDQETGDMHTAHTMNKVPAILTKKGVAIHDGGLADIAPTVLSLFDLPIPRVMTGRSLIGN